MFALATQMLSDTVDDAVDNTVDNTVDNEQIKIVSISRADLNYFLRGCGVYIKIQQELQKMHEHIEVTYCRKPDCHIFDIEMPTCMYEKSPGYEYVPSLTNGYCKEHLPIVQ